MPEIKVKERLQVVQHSEWNEKQTTPESLTYVKNNSNYIKVADGNKVGNGTPGFQDSNFTQWKSKIGNPKLIPIWQSAVDLANQYDGKEGRYKNKAISVGGLDFSDLSEVCWILGLQDIKDVEEFFNRYAN